MAELNDALLAHIMPNASATRRAACLEPLNAALERYDIGTLARTAAFLAQLAHESGELQFMQEIWGPTAAQKRYEPPSELARRLGNTRAGDGFRYRGRGPIQITGRDNYRRYGRALELDLEGQPEQAAQPGVGFLIAGEFWSRNRLNALADAGDFDAITKRINGGMNGAAERRRLHARALQVLAPMFAAAPPAGAAPRGTRAGGARPADKSARAQPPITTAARATAGRFLRGHEAIAALAATGEKPGKTSSTKRHQAAGQRGRSAKADSPIPARTLDVRPDTLDFRDRMYEATLIEVPTHVPLGEYLEHGVPVLDQGTEGACTGFGLATVAHYLLRRRQVLPDLTPVSPRMLYELARRYDEWPGEDYSGSSARGAMKGWHKHGVCAETLYPYHGGAPGAGLTDARTADALRRPLGSYFRVNHKDLVAMHSAIAEVGILYATCTVHEGWSKVGPDGVIELLPKLLGGHAFAIVAYDDQGLWLQNSWGPTWGRGGFGRISYDDWLSNGTDLWAARLGAPVTLRRLESAATVHSGAAAQSSAYSYADLRPHIISVGNDGQLKAGGDYGSTPAELAQIFEDDMPRAMQGWARPRVLLYAHGGLVDERSAVQRLADYRAPLLEGQVYPLAFVWRTDFWSTVTNILDDAARQRRPEGVLDATKDFMLDRFDDALEPLARMLGGKLMWDQMKQNALAASQAQGAAVRVADHLQALAARLPGLEVHLVGHSAGSILLAPTIELLGRRGLRIKTCTLWAPACTVALFRAHYLPALQRKQIDGFALFNLSDKAEQDDHCAHLYNKSLLYLVSDAFEEKARIPLLRQGEPLLGMERWLDDALRKEIAQAGGEVITAPNTWPDESPSASRCTTHGGFDDDMATVTSTFRRIMLAGQSASAKARDSAPMAPEFHRSASSLRARRTQLARQTRRDD